ncbi:PRC-barrel domain-containing protein [Sphingomonas sp. DBB INV C78]|uniref:PRC-barrel domain-containing protein n=1 Tax=Sphingomonas sp. DBB INV C78 TaxID=3349434 RepID=UPI0036D262C7
MIAAMMTAANLGARVTGWGFVVFTVGSVGWSIVGLTSDQPNLLATNAFLTLVNGVGIWRWLGRQRAYEDGGQSAARKSARSAAPTLFPATCLAGMSVEDVHGKVLGTTVEGLIECATGCVSYVVVASGGVGGIDEVLRAVPRDQVAFRQDRFRLNIEEEAFQELPELAAGNWPAQITACPGDRV